MSNEKTAFVDKSRIEPTIFLIEKMSFSLKLFSGHFDGQSFIKTVRGPLQLELDVIRYTGRGTGLGTGLSLACRFGDYFDIATAFLFDGMTDFIKG